MPRRRSWRAAAVVAVVALSACSGGTSHSSTSTSATTTPPAPASTTTQPTASTSSPTESSTTSTTVPGPPVTAAMQALVVQAGDLPAGWTSEAAQVNSADDASSSAALAYCVGTRDTYPDETAVAASGFSMAGNDVSSNAAEYRSQSDVQSDIALVKSQRASGCLESQLRRQITQGFGSNGITVQSVSLTITLGGPPNVVATANAKASVSTGQGPATLYADITFITGARTEVEITFLGTDAQVPTSLEQAVTAKVAARVGKA